MKPLFLAAAAATALATTGAFAMPNPTAQLPAGNEWDYAQLKAHIPGITWAEFNVLDINGDNMVSRTELEAVQARTPNAGEQAVSALNGLDLGRLPAGNSWSRAQLDAYIPGMTPALFDRIDTSGDNMVSRTELQAAMEDNSTEAPDQVTASAGLIARLPAGNEWSREQLTNYLPNLTVSAFNAIDTDGNNMASRSELEAAMSKGVIVTPGQMKS